MGLHLADFPEDVLSEITSHLSAFYILRTFYEVGQKTLMLKFYRGGVRKLQLDNLTCSYTDLERLAMFDGLLSLRIAWTSSKPLLEEGILPYLPRGLIDLEMRFRGAEEEWLQIASKEFLADPRNALFLANGRTVRNVGIMFPRLKRFHVERAQDLLQTQWSDGMVLLFLRLLPRSLDYLHFSPLMRLNLSPLEVIPPYLSTLSMGQLMSPVLAPSPQNLTNFRFIWDMNGLEGEVPSMPQTATKMVIEVRNGFPTVPFLPTTLTSLRLVGSHYRLVTLSEEHLASLPKSLRNLKISVETKFVSNSDFKFPPNLTRLSLCLPTETSNQTSLKLIQSLPTQITSLHYRGLCPLDSSTLIQNLPCSHLRRLEIPRHDLRPMDAIYVPRSITYLQAIMNISEAFIDLPPGLLSLHVCSQSRSSEDVSCSLQFMEALPKGLTSLVVASNVDDVVMLAAPPSLTEIKFNHILVTGLLHHHNRNSFFNPAHFELGKYLYFDPKTHHRNHQLGLAESPFSTKPLPYVNSRKDGSMGGVLLTLKESPQFPPTVTRFVARVFITRIWTFTGRLTGFAHLQELDFEAYSVHDNVDALVHLTNLKTLIIHNHLPSSLCFNTPPNLTCLRIRKAWDEPWTTKPPSSLVYFEVSDVATNLVSPLVNLKTFKIFGSIGEADVAQLPKSITKLRCRLEVPLPTLRAALPDLVALSGHFEVTVNMLEDMLASEKNPPQMRLSRLFTFVDIPDPSDLLAKVGFTTPVETPVNELVVQAFGLRYPFVTWNSSTKFNFQFTQKSWQEGVVPLIPTHLTELVLRDFTAPAKFAASLPHTLTRLDIEGLQGNMNHVPRDLPPSLTQLRMNAKGFSTASYTALPRLITHLTLSGMTKMTPKDASALPPSLLHLTIDPMQANDAVLTALPRSITELIFTRSTNGFNKFRELPPNIRILHADLSKVYEERRKILAIEIPCLSSPREDRLEKEFKREYQTKVLQKSSFDQLCAHLNIEQ